MLSIREAIAVEGRYDKNALAQVVKAVIVETAGFRVFKDREKLNLLRRLASQRGLIVLTDPDGAGLVIRNYLRGAIPPAQLKHAYIPEVWGKERRKRAPGKEGKLGVEGMSPQVLVQALLRAGATVEGEQEVPPRGALTPADLFALGLTGRPDSAVRREKLLHRLGLPQHMNSKAMLAMLNALHTPDEVAQMVEELDLQSKD